LAQNNKENLLVGTWMFDGGKELVMQANGEIFMQEGDYRRKNGTWKLANNNTTFQILEEGRVVEEAKVVSIKPDEFVIQTGREEITFIKLIALTPNEANKRRELLVGYWVNEEQGITLRLQMDGTAQSTYKTYTYDENDEQASVEQTEEAKWKLDDTGQRLVISLENGNVQLLGIKAVEQTRLILSGERKTLVFVRE
jgi:hypothetical protein